MPRATPPKRPVRPSGTKAEIAKRAKARAPAGRRTTAPSPIAPRGRKPPKAVGWPVGGVKRPTRRGPRAIGPPKQRKIR
mgnify:CR=1 FL=1